jgi:hypothetical protein
MENNTWTALRLNVYPVDKKEMLKEVLAVPDDMWHHNTFRDCYMLPIFNSKGRIDENFKGQDMKWTSAGELCSYLQEVITSEIFPWMEPHGRVTILRTPADKGLNVHFDVNKNEIGTRQQKFRLVLNGNIDKLFFLDENAEKVYVPQDYDTYVMDGGHPHALDPGDEEKITICIGSPWDGKPTDLYKEILDESPYVLNISRPKEIKQEWLDPFWPKNRK